MDNARDEIYQYFRKNPNKKVTSTFLAIKFGVSKGYVTNCIRHRPRSLNIVRETEDGVNYYYRPGPEKVKEEL